MVRTLKEIMPIVKELEDNDEFLIDKELAKFRNIAESLKKAEEMTNFYKKNRSYVNHWSEKDLKYLTYAFAQEYLKESENPCIIQP